MKKYTPVPDIFFDQPDDFLLVENVFLHLLGIFDGQILPPAILEQRTDIPGAAKIAWHLWQFGIDVASSGIPDYLLNRCDSVEKVAAVHRALTTIGEVELRTLLESAIPVAVEVSQEYGESSILPQDKWFDQFPRGSGSSDFGVIAEQSYKLAGETFFEQVARFLRAHRQELQR